MQNKEREEIENMYKIMHHQEMGYALFEYNYEAQMWQQVTKWYRYLGNLKRFANI